MSTELTDKSSSDSSNQKQSSKNLIFNLIALCISILFCLLLLEIGARIYYSSQNENITALENYQRKTENENITLIDLIIPTQDSEMVYDLFPGQAGIYNEVQTRINSHGMRDVEFSKEKPEEIFRIAGLGDSVTFGWGIELENTYLKILEIKLNEFAGENKYQVLNFGIPGYNAAMEKAMLQEKILNFEPDLILMQFCGNDFDLPNFIRKKPEVLSLTKSFGLIWLAERISNLKNRDLQSGFQSKHFEAPPIVKGSDGFHRYSFVPGEVPEEYRHMVGREGFGNAMHEIAKTLKENDIPGIYLPFCSWYDELTETGRLIDEETTFKWLVPQAEDLGFKVVDPAPDALEFIKQKEKDSRLFWIKPDDTHPNTLHSTLIAKASFRVLVENKLIPDAEKWLSDLPEYLARFDQAAEKVYQLEKSEILKNWEN